MSSWWPWGGPKQVPHMRPVDAQRNDSLRRSFFFFMDHTDPPKTFRATEVAIRLKKEELAEMGYFKWEDAMPAVMELAFELRSCGYCLIYRGGGVPIHEDKMACEITEDVNIMRKEM